MNSLNQKVQATLTCKKCPLIKGDTWCSFHEKEIWKEDQMCEQGYLARIDKGINLCGKIYTEGFPVDEERIDKIMEQVYELEKIWYKKYHKEEKYDGTKFQVQGGVEVPF